MIDLHLHTSASDGLLSLERLVKKAEEVHLSAVAITDHDSIQNARRISSLNSHIEVIPGAELSIFDDKRNYVDLHVLGLFLDTENANLISTLDRLDRERKEQKLAIIGRLNELGYEITYEEAQAKAKGSVGRPHIARVLIEKYPNEFKLIPDVFIKLLDRGKPAFFARSAFFSLEEAVSTIHTAGGLAFLAHPEIYPYELDRILSDFKVAGGDGIETVYDYARNYAWKGYTDNDNLTLRKKFGSLASKMGFLQSGGSDFHGPNKGAPLGTLDVPDLFLEEMKGLLNANHS